MSRFTKTLEEFIDENRGELDSCIRNVLGPNHDLDDDDREQWIMNDEGLYLWAKGEGVNVDDEDEEEDDPDDHDFMCMCDTCVPMEGN